MKRTMLCIAAALLVLGACGGDDDTEPAAGDDVEAPAATTVELTANDYSFDMPDTIEAGVVAVQFTNAGKEPHFAGFAKAAPGKTFDDVKAAMTAPPSDDPPAGPPPFEEAAGAPTADPGVSASMTFELEPGTYAVFCMIPSPDGVPHAAKGMIKEVTVTEGGGGSQPDAVGTVVATDFALTGTPTLEAGTQTLALRNDGKQLHEINLVELPDGKKVEDVVAWAGKPDGPPPHRSLSGVAVKPGTTGTADLELEAGKTYALVCVIPDVTGDFAPHIVKGMFTPAFTPE